MNNPQIQEVLSALGIQMHDLAKELGWSYETLAEYATTPKNVPWDIVHILCERLNVEADVFFDDRYKTLTK